MDNQIPRKQAKTKEQSAIPEEVLGKIPAPGLLRMFPHCQALLNAVRVFAVLGLPADPLMLALALEDPQIRELVEKRLQKKVKRFQEAEIRRQKDQTPPREEFRGAGGPIKRARRSTPLRALMEGFRSCLRR